MRKFIISIDAGTTSNRSILFDLKGNPVFSSQKEFTQYFPKSGWVEHDPDEIWKTTVKTLKDVIQKAKKLRGKILGITCHNSEVLANDAIENKADYIAFGSFNKSKLKPNAKKANLNIIKWAKKNIKIPIVAIGGINNTNYKKLMNTGAKYIALSSFIWDNPKLKPEQAIRKFK